LANRPGDADVLRLNPALAAALSSLSPTPEESSLLAACVCTGETATRAWSESRRRLSGLVDLFRGEAPDVRRLAPLLLEALRREQAPVEKSLLTVLRTAYHREELRSREYRRVCHSVLGALAEAGVPLIVFRGAALGETAYGSPVLRHSHDLNLLVPEAEQANAAAVLAACGCVPERGGSAPDALTLLHESQLPIMLHTRLFRVSYYHVAWTELWDRSVSGVVADRAVRLLSPEDTLLHTCSQATQRPRRLPLAWACDAYVILRHYPELDWTVFLDVAERSRTRLPAYIALRYLAEALSCAIPRPALEQLEAAAARFDPAERDIALLAARQRAGGALGSVLTPSADWRVRVTQLRWLLLPSPAYVRWAYGVHRRRFLPLYYVGRLLRYLARRPWRPAPPAVGRPARRVPDPARTAAPRTGS
jgi:hypothetical protein